VTLPYFDDGGAASTAKARLVTPTRDIAPLAIFPGLEFRPLSTEKVMVSFVSFEAGAPAPRHRHPELQISICVSGQITFTVTGETLAMGPGDCIVIPPRADHEAVAGPQGCHVIDIFSPPREAMLRLMSEDLLMPMQHPDG
jgi:quercetin dioxygenase-like cupin family protein